jgi:hypothetical protein
MVQIPGDLDPPRLAGVLKWSKRHLPERPVIIGSGFADVIPIGKPRWMNLATRLSTSGAKTPAIQVAIDGISSAAYADEALVETSFGAPR